MRGTCVDVDDGDDDCARCPRCCVKKNKNRRGADTSDRDFDIDLVESSVKIGDRGRGTSNDDGKKKEENVDDKKEGTAMIVDETTVGLTMSKWMIEERCWAFNDDEELELIGPFDGTPDDIDDADEEGADDEDEEGGVSMLMLVVRHTSTVRTVTDDGLMRRDKAIDTNIVIPSSPSRCALVTSFTLSPSPLPFLFLLVFLV